MMPKKKKILLIDDDETHLSIATVILEDVYEISSAKSGKEALDHLLHGTAPDLILLDLLMPQMDGWETFNRLKAISYLKDVPVAFMTSVHGTEEKNQARKIGAADYITKPFEKKELLKRVKNILENLDVQR